MRGRAVRLYLGLLAYAVEGFKREIPNVSAVRPISRVQYNRHQKLNLGWHRQEGGWSGFAAGRKCLTSVALPAPRYRSEWPLPRPTSGPNSTVVHLAGVPIATGPATHPSAPYRPARKSGLLNCIGSSMRKGRAVTLDEFEKQLAGVIGRPTDLRPFVCEGSPLDCDVFIVGSNPATKMEGDWWRFWRPGIWLSKERLVQRVPCAARKC